MKLCADCKHVFRWSEDWLCDRLTSDRVDIVTGEFLDRLRVPCRIERQPGTEVIGFFKWRKERERCGPDAQFFEASMPKVGDDE